MKLKFLVTFAFLFALLAFCSGEILAQQGGPKTSPTPTPTPVSNAVPIVFAAELEANSSPQKFYIYGTNLSSTSPATKVTLGGQPLKIESNDGSKIVATAISFTYPAGSYALKVAASNSSFVTFEMTLGGVGTKGEQGIQGIKGDTGETGAQGLQGIQGLKGDKGDTGATGQTGPVGERGEIGPVGAMGPKGDKGDKGDIGVAGPTGATGEKGEKGDTGLTGAQGLPGETGPMGPQGPQGPIGLAGPQGPAGDPTGEVALQIQSLLQSVQALTAKVSALEADSSPVGTIMAFGGSRIPAGWALCDGTLLPKNATTQALFDAIGASWGSSDSGATNFRLPDLRGRFLRGLDLSSTGTASGRDNDRASRSNDYAGQSSGNNVGSVQGDAFQTHNHQTNIRVLSTYNGSGLGWTGSTGSIAGHFEPSSFAGNSTETRPKNAAVLYIIRVK